MRLLTLFLAGVVAEAVMAGCTGSDESEPAPGPVRLPSSVPSQVWSVADEGGPIAVVDGTVFVGNVSMVGRSSGAFAEFRVGSAVPKLADPDVRGGDVLAIVDDGAGGWVIAGEFTTVGVQPCRGLAHLTADDRLDRRLCLGVDQPVTALARRGSTVYLAGSFTRVGGEPRSNLAALDLESGRLLPWTATVTGRPAYDPAGGGHLTPPYVSALAVLGDTVYIGGFFEQVGGEPRTNLAALDASSARVLTWRADVGEPLAAEREVYDWDPDDVAVLEAVRGRLYVSGYFSRISGEPRESIGAVDPATGRVLDWRVRPALRMFGGASDIAVHEGAVYLALPGGGGRSLAVVDADTGRARPYGPFEDSVSDVHTLNALAVDGHRLVVGGSFDGRGGHTDASFLTIDLRSEKVLGRGPATDGSVTALAVHDGAVALGGGFRMIVSAVRDGLASFDARTGKLLPFRPRLAFDEPYEGVSALAVDGSTLYLDGRFTAVDGRPRTGLAAIDITTGKLTDWAPTVTTEGEGGGLGVLTAGKGGGLALEGDAVYVDGGFDTVNGEPREGLAAIDASSGELLDWQPASDYPPASDYLATVEGGVVYMTEYEGGIAGADAKSGEWLEWTPAMEKIGESYEEAEIGEVVGHDGRVYIGGNFRSFDGYRRSGVVALDAATQEVLPFRARIPQTIERHWDSFSDVLAVADDLLAVTSPVSGRLMLFDPISGRRLSWRPHGDPSLNECSSVAIDSSALVAMCGGRLLFFPRKSG